ncbi:hypothetical protein HDU92_000033 [Lobulomyces angularis]|nr:hypothetical protein HDU92_000033 [Lobulomyces angularis]
MVSKKIVYQDLSKHAKKVVLTGNFDNWAKTLTMNKVADGNSFEYNFDAKIDQKIIFKFFIDDNYWMTSSDYEVLPDDHGNLNNVIFVKDVESKSGTESTKPLSTATLGKNDKKSNGLQSEKPISENLDGNANKDVKDSGKIKAKGGDVEKSVNAAEKDNYPACVPIQPQVEKYPMDSQKLKKDIAPAADLKEKTTKNKKKANKVKK